MDIQMTQTLMATVELMNTTLDTAPDSWRDHLQAIRTTTDDFELADTTPDEERRRWQIPLISVFQRVAFADADNGPIPDIADWCLRQLLTLLHVYPSDVEILDCKSQLHLNESSLTFTVIGRNWLLRAQQPLASIAQAENDSSSGDPSTFGEPDAITRTISETERRLYDADYVEARRLLVQAADYLKRAVDAALAEARLTETLLSTAAKAFRSLDNVMSARDINGDSRANERYPEHNT
ncbi:hypothetical protein A1F94_007216 [Pyrenophora tritici-repentis]|uniref:Uncharacterized protein n=1 Tax=Pyrenophora tritici-repentis (strain Pt-1C-BFP) TaxID=426418 RepID=B2WDK2_PYRTR|nr:uncharacterized protein PTRG_08061 [Pyrenophora tritici-repentis Pt-1C-BFP]KAA8616589.1 hypothetical protein PtrV1_09890 [Pyrenophora tritici-repentis]EDU50980.1 predicted protein [Pyrenophora tritici-repentis Pt-1C-BFP]KAF7445848.1 hypothetical protein A1F99_091390 [Pyrenophora tritici-repentis]KAG9381562.1 hypothetical protein A1F94_007216 [Pyrenophora tritici-repentis]KAI0573417.1 hypothetical protein Alg215_09204 [Pyrenophora tritici-repentis]